MGLDMSIYKINKKMDKETFDKAMTAAMYDETDDDFMGSASELLDRIGEKYDCDEAIEFYCENTNDEVVKMLKEEPVIELEFHRRMKEKEKKSSKTSYEDYLKFIAKKKDRLMKNLFNNLAEAVKKHKKRKEAFLELNKTEESKSLLKAIKNTEEVAYWRKHSDLNGYMRDLYYGKGGAGDFNCKPLLLSKEDVEHIIIDHKAHLDKDNEYSIEESRGFFWGESDMDNWKQSLKDFEKIIEETDWNNSTIYYSCWW